MSYSPAPSQPFTMPMVSVVSLMAVPLRLTNVLAATGSFAWPTANGAKYVPFRQPVGVVIKRLWVVVGTTGGTDTWDLGIYTDGGVQVVHMGSTTAGTASTVQFMDITDTYLPPGAYYMAMSSSGTTATVTRWAPASDMTKPLGILNQATAHPLPATATFATAGSVGFLPLFGYCTTASP